MAIKGIQNNSLTNGSAALLVLLCIAFGANAVAIKVTITGIGVLTSAGLRFAMAAVIIYLWVRLTGRDPALPAGKIKPILISSAVFSVQLALYYSGLARTEASRGVLIINAQPFFVLIFAHFFIPGDRITMRKIFGMLLGFAGLLLAVKKPDASTIQPGDLLVLGGTLIWAGNTVFIKRVIHDYQAFHFPLYTSFVSAPLFITAGYFFDQGMIFHLDAAVIISLLYQGVITASLGFVLWNWLMQRYGASSMHSFIFIIPFSGVFFGSLILKEELTQNLVYSMILITLGILIIHFRGKNLSVFPFRRGNL